MTFKTGSERQGCFRRKCTFCEGWLLAGMQNFRQKMHGDMKTRSDDIIPIITLTRLTNPQHTGFFACSVS